MCLHFVTLHAFEEMRSQAQLVFLFLAVGSLNVFPFLVRNGGGLQLQKLRASTCLQDATSIDVDVAVIVSASHAQACHS
jgi:hypothetical protein